MRLAASLKQTCARDSSSDSSRLTARGAGGQALLLYSASTARITPSQTFAIKSRFKVSKVSVEP